MAGGIDISIGAAETLGESAGLAIVAVSTGSSSIQQVLNAAGITVPTLGPYRDKQQNKPATYMLTVPKSATTPAGQAAGIDAATGQYTLVTSAIALTNYVFDAVLVANHSKRYDTTKKPLQSGFNISDHAIKRQPVVTLEIGMSDAMDAYATGMWTGNPSKSISAWQQISSLADNRVLMTLSTRQETYTNMLIVSIDSPETNATIKGLKARITFEQQLIVDVTTETASARPNATDSTQQATVQGQDVSSTIVQQNEVTPAQLPVGNSASSLNANGIPAGGQFSSNVISTTSGLGQN